MWLLSMIYNYENIFYISKVFVTNIIIIVYQSIGQMYDISIRWWIRDHYNLAIHFNSNFTLKKLSMTLVLYYSIDYCAFLLMVYF